MKKSYKTLTSILLFLIAIQATFAQFKIPEIPRFQTSLYDYANLLNNQEKIQLEEKLVRYSDSTSTQIVVITIDDLKGEDVGVLATIWAQKWGIGGTKDKDNGVIILVSKNDRQISIRPGYGVEDRLVAGICGEIIRNVITPQFKAGSYYNGLDKGTNAVFDVLKGEYKGQRIEDEPSILPFILFLLLFLLIIYFISKNRGGNSGTGGFNGSTDLSDMIILSRMGRGGSFGGGFGGSSSGGGGFGGGFGGGGFSGGGASGSW